MTKTLTEQWREGTLPAGSYYINLVGGVERVDFFDGIEWARTKDFRIEEVLSPVPSYDEHKKLQKKLEIATKALNRICEICTLNTKQPLYIAQFTNRKVKVSLKEMESVK